MLSCFGWAINAFQVLVSSTCLIEFSRHLTEFVTLPTPLLQKMFALRSKNVISLATVLMPLSFVQVVESGLAWEEIEWGPASVWIRGVHYPVVRAHFMPRRLLGQ